MQITIRDFMGCERADVSVSPIALIGGHNAQGKSSICRAAAYALSGQPVPAGMTKASAGALVRVGAAKATVAVATDNGSVSVIYPKALLESEGQVSPWASVWATGLRAITDLPEKERVEILRELIGAQPTEKDFQDAVADAGIDAKHMQPLWELIAVNGWDAAHKRAQDKGREIKAQWEYATGEKYGEKKAESWLPHNWSSAIENASFDALQAIVTGAKADLEGIIASQAVAEEKVAVLRDTAAKADDLMAQGKAASEALKAAETTFASAKAALDEMPTGQQRKPLQCPHCAAGVFYNKTLQGESLVKAEGLIPDDEIAAQREAYKAAADKVAELKAALDAARGKYETLRVEYKQALDAAEKLAALPQGTATQADIDRAREALRVAENDLKAFQQKTEGDRLHRGVQDNQRIIDMLAPDGVRRVVLVRALEAFNKELDAIAKACGWSRVEITPDLDVEYAGRVYFLLSESEQFRTRVTLQLAIARRDGSAAVVIDGADVLDAAGRGGLFRALNSLRIPAMVGMMANKREALPDLATMSAGKTYWIEKGILND